MALFGGSKSKKTTTNNVDNRALMASGNTGVAVMGEGNVVTTTDFGSVAAGVELSRDALEYGVISMREGYGFSSGVTDRAFDAIDKTSERSFDFVNDVFDSALAHSESASAEAFDSISENNLRIDEIYKTAGRETSADSMNIIKVMAALTAVVLVVGVVRAK